MIADPRKMILDCDPGHDDAIAMLLAYGHPNIDLRLVTTVCGNQTVDKTTRNALNVAAFAGMDVPIAKGLDRSILGRRLNAPEIHGESGLDGPVFPPTERVPVARHAVDCIIDMVMDSGGDMTLVPTGPLSNIAMAMIKEPAIVPKIREIVLMGGAIYFGNKTAAAEFNIVADPEAARIVFESGVPITMVGLELTHQALATADIVHRIRAIGNRVSKLVVELLDFFGKSYRNVYGFEGPPIHDACAVAYVIDPQVFSTKRYRVDIETKGEFTSGMTVVDLFNMSGRPANVNVAMELDRERFWNILIETLSGYR